MRNQKGNLVEYVIPAGILALTLGLAIIKMANINIFGNFWAASIDGKVEQDHAISISKISQPNSSWGASSQKSLNGGTPTVNCANNFCTVTVSGITLRTVPNNFNQIVQSSGTSGATDSMINLLREISTQLEAQGSAAEADQIAKLANLGHNIARIEEQFETDIKKCNGNTSCLSSLFSRSTFQQPVGFNTSVGTFPAVSYKDAKYLLEIGTARAILSGLTGSFKIPSQDVPAYQYMVTYDEIMKNSNIDGSIKSLISQLTWTIGTLAEDFNDNVWAVEHPEFHGTVQEGYIRDPLTGERSFPDKDFTNVSTYKNFIQYNANQITDISASLQCASTATGTDTGKVCNQSAS